MSAHAKTWWGQQFIAALEDFTDSGRLARGRSYSTDNRIKQWVLQKGKVEAKMRGNINPYFGVYKEPTYKVSVQMTHLSEGQWQKIIQKLSQRASFIARLLLNEIPENIETVFTDVGVHFLPNDYKDFNVSCNCPDYEVPCKHIAGVCYRLAGQLDQDPFLLFEMRGLAPEKLLQELALSPLGKVLSDAKSSAAVDTQPVSSFYTRPVLTELPKEIRLKDFWQGQLPLPKSLEPGQAATVPAMLIKKGGDFPAFWQKQNSFIDVMEDFYLRMRKATLKGL
ncbi:SWIM zinc finger family protein [Methylobacter psychrophilus]|uniref:SWIM zinc finger family protein n=1 Tax=Methylobacter psychrophilus TaxID=96941 RepID=UPI0021D48B9E|nr:SWIM zinc finger family protein [Methylobacter psychrophilus]